jgi:hypothetical protein
MDPGSPTQRLGETALSGSEPIPEPILRLPAVCLVARKKFRSNSGPNADELGPESCTTTENKARRANEIDFLQLPWAQEVWSSNLDAPANPFSAPAPQSRLHRAPDRSPRTFTHNRVLLVLRTPARISSCECRSWNFEFPVSSFGAGGAVGSKLEPHLHPFPFVAVAGRLQLQPARHNVGGQA